MVVSNHSLQLPPELWEKIFSYLSKNEVLKLRTVNNVLLHVVPERHCHPHVLDLTWSVISNKSCRLARKSLTRALKQPSDRYHGQWYTTLRITPHIEYLGGRPLSFLDGLRSWLLERISNQENAVKGLTRTLCQHTLPSMPSITTLWVNIVDKSIKLSPPSKNPIFPHHRCPYVDVAWSQYSMTLTTLEVVIYPKTRWPSFRPEADIKFPALKCLRVKWAFTSLWPSIAIDLGSKAPILEELGVNVATINSCSPHLPHDPLCFPYLKIFRWGLSNGWRSTLDREIRLFFEAFTPQLQHLSIRIWQSSLLASGGPSFDISKLRSFSLDMGREFGSSERGMLEQLETPGLCQNLRRFVLRCLEWKSSEMIRLFDGLAQLGSSLRELFLFLPSYSTNWLLRIAKSTPRLESLHLVIAKQWYTNDGRSFIVHIPYSIFAKEVVSECGMDPELQAWKLCDITIRELGYDMRAPESNAILMTAIASVVTTIYSFYGLGHKEVVPPCRDLNKGSLDSTAFAWLGEDL